MRRLRVAPNRRYLQYEDGAPFFYLGDTAWELFHRLNLTEAERYLANRAAKGFTVIQAVVLAQLGGVEEPNANGDLPLLDNDPTRPNERFFRHVDAIVDMAAALGLTIGMLPTWGDKWKQERKQTTAEAPAIFTVESARSYGAFVGTRYRDKPLIWILGGDQNIDSEAEASVITAMARGLREADGGDHLITYHPRGPGRSSDFFHAADWLDFNMIQSSHGAQDHDNGLFVAQDYALTPPKPTVDGEPRYETIQVGFYNAEADRNIRFDAYDVRQAAYWALFAGACGHTYGNNAIWQMWQPGRDSLFGARVPWYEALDHPGAFQMRLVRRLFESRPFQRLIPDESFILDAPHNGGSKVRAMRADDGSFAFVYSPRGERFSVRKDVVQARWVQETWYDPRYGIASPFHKSDNRGIQTFTPPTSGRGNDWILVLDDAARGFGLPGQVG